MEVSIVISAYEIANLIQALRMVPNNGDWYASLISKINAELAKHDPPLELHHNAGMDIKNVRRHLDLMEHRKKHMGIDNITRPW